MVVIKFLISVVRIAEDRCSLFSFPTENPASFTKNIGADTLVSSLGIYYYCTKISSLVSQHFCLEKNGQIPNKNIPEKHRGAVWWQYTFENIIIFFIACIILELLSRYFPVVTQIRGHIAGPPPPFSLRHVLSFSSREVSIFFPRRLVSNCTYPRC